MRSPELFDSSYDQLSACDKIDLCLETLSGISQKKISVNGLAAAGKGTLAERIVTGLDLKKVSTGDIYRAITWYLLAKGLTKKNIEELDDEQLRQELFELEIDFSSIDSDWWVMNPQTGARENIGSELHSAPIDSNISSISQRNPIRDIVDSYQRKIVKENDNVFLEGRDMWQVFEGVEGVFLVYLYASNEELISREVSRQKELGNIIGKEEARMRVIERNMADNNRERGQLLLPEQVEAGRGGYQLIIDTTQLKPEAVYLQVLEKLCSRLTAK